MHIQICRVHDLMNVKETLDHQIEGNPGFQSDAPMGADENLSSGANGVPETPDTGMAVECIWERFEQECDANKLRDPVLNELSK